MALRHQSVKPAAVADAEALKFISRCVMGWGRSIPRRHVASRIQSLRTRFKFE